MCLKSQYKCVCSWPECQEICDTLIEFCGMDHVWCEPMIRLQLTPEKNEKKLTIPTLQKFVFNHCLFLYLPIDSEVDIDQRNKCIMFHHFPRALLEWKQEQEKVPNFSIFLPRLQMQSILDLDNGSDRLLENNNSF